MEWALAPVPVHDFVRPPGLVNEVICPGTGLSPDATCTDRFNEVFIAGTQPYPGRVTSTQAPIVALGSPPSGTQYQINLSVPRAYQAAPVDVQASGVAPGSVQVLLDGKPIYRFPGAGGEWMWPLSLGTHRFQAVARDRQGHVVRSGVSIVQVIKPQAPL
jgi:hypothetical protein